LNKNNIVSTYTSRDQVFTEVKPPLDSNFSCWLSGVIILALNKIKHSIQGYTSPRTFPINEIARAVEYDYSVVALWKYFLNDYRGESYSIENKTILELGPGADLGVGLILLSIGANKYNSLDINNLVETVPDELYEHLFEVMGQQDNIKRQADDLARQLELTKSNTNEELNYVCDPTFNIGRFKDEDIDLVLSNAAFEHFDDIQTTLSQLSDILKPGGTLLAEIDLSTHTRWIRDKDPLNIYRYSPFYYNMMKFSGTPNRIRPNQYAEYLDKNGWTNIKLIPYRTLEMSYVEHVQPNLDKSFRSAKSTMKTLSFILCATR